MLTLTRYLVILAGALALGLTVAQLLGGPVTPWLSGAVAASQVTALLSALMALLLSRHRRGLWLLVIGTPLLALSSIVSIALTRTAWLKVASESGVPLVSQLITSGDLPLIAFGLWLLGFSLHVIAALRDQAVNAKTEERGPIPLFRSVVTRAA